MWPRYDKSGKGFQIRIANIHIAANACQVCSRLIHPGTGFFSPFRIFLILLKDKWSTSMQSPNNIINPKIKLIPPIKTPLKNVYLATMHQIYPWDRGTNYAVKLGKEVADEIIKK